MLVGRGWLEKVRGEVPVAEGPVEVSEFDGVVDGAEEAHCGLCGTCSGAWSSSAWS